MRTAYYPRIIAALIILTAGVLIPVDTYPLSSKSKSPEEQATDDNRQATEKYNNGVKHLDKGRAHESKEDSLFAFNYRATPLAKARSEYRKAIGDFEEAIALRPAMIEALNNLGFCLRKLDRLPESLEAYDIALGIDSLYAPAREYRGELFLAMGDLNRAAAELEFLKSLSSPYADTLSMSIVQFRLTQFNEATKK